MVTGDLTLHGVTKTLTSPGSPHRLSETWQAGEGRLRAGDSDQPEGLRDRLEPDRGQGGTVLGDDVEINVQVEANKEMPKDPAAAAPEPTKAPTAGKFSRCGGAPARLRLACH